MRPGPATCTVRLTSRMRTLASLDDLLTIDGAVAAAEFTPNTKLTDYRSALGDVPRRPEKGAEQR